MDQALQRSGDKALNVLAERSKDLFFEASQISNEICRYITNGQVDKSNGQKEFERKSLSEELPRQKGRPSEDIDLVFEVSSRRQASNDSDRYARL